MQIKINLSHPLPKKVRADKLHFVINVLGQLFSYKYCPLERDGSKEIENDKGVSHPSGKHKSQNKMDFSCLKRRGKAPKVVNYHIVVGLCGVFVLGGCGEQE